MELKLYINYLPSFNLYHKVYFYPLLQKLPRGILYEATAAKDSQNMKMNCYKDIIACKFLFTLSLLVRDVKYYPLIKSEGYSFGLVCAFVHLSIPLSTLFGCPEPYHSTH